MKAGLAVVEASKPGYAPDRRTANVAADGNTNLENLVLKRLEGWWEQASAWAEDELFLADALGLVPASLRNADLTGPITRTEFAAVAVLAYEAVSGKTTEEAAANPFADTDDSMVLRAFATDLAVGISDELFDPDSLLSREQAATILTRVIKKQTLPGWTFARDEEYPLTYEQPEPFADDADISGWARDSVYFMAANGIVSGLDTGNFAPRAVTDAHTAGGYATATREQALALSVRLVGSLRQEADPVGDTTE